MVPLKLMFRHKGSTYVKNL